MNQKRNTKAKGKKTLRQKNNSQLASVDVSRFKMQPPKMIVKLGYQKALSVTSASTSTSIYFNANGAYDIDPTVGNLTLAGFNEWMAIYGIFHVTKFRAKITAINNEVFPLRFATGFFPAFQTVFGTSSWNNLHCVEHPMLGSTAGMGRTTVIREINLRDLIHSANYDGDLNQYYGTSASNPASLTSFNIGLASVDGQALTNGAVFAIEIDLIIELSYPIRKTQV